MKINMTLFRIALATLLLIHSVQCFHWSSQNTRLLDLEFEGDNFFEEAKSWRATGSIYDQTLKTSQCFSASDIVLGGPGILKMDMFINGWYRMYTGLPTHTAIKVQMKIYPIDGWIDEEIGLQIESFSTSLGKFSQQTNPSALTDTCGSVTKDIPPLTAYVTMKHSSTKYIQIFAFIYSSRSSAELSIGIREVAITFFDSNEITESSVCAVSPYPLDEKLKCPCELPLTESTGTSGHCEVCDSSCLRCNKLGPDGCTACQPGEYLTKEGYCLKCSNRCKTCSADPNFCITCQTAQDGFPLMNGKCPCPSSFIEVGENCVTPCEDPNDFTYWFGGCSPKCEKPLTPGESESSKICYSSCLESVYLYDDGTCHSDCPSPLKKFVNENKNFCNFPCPDGGYLYWDGICRSSCSAPYLKVDQTHFCDYPCGENQSLDMIRATCITGVCPEFYEEKIDDHGKRLCNFPCQKEEYLYWNGDCKPSCSDPYLKDDSTHFCDYPCDENQSFDMIREHCITGACPEFYEEKTDDHGKKLCNFPCQKEEYLYWNGDCKPSCSDPYLKDDSTHFCDYPCDENQSFDMIREHCITGACPEFYEEKTDDHGKKLCNFPCQKEEYLYWNGDCKPSCSDPYLKDDSTHFCDYPCVENDLLDMVREHCITGVCPEFYEEKIDDHGKKLCNFPCQKEEYLYWNGDCKPSCSDPYLKDDATHFCDYPCVENDLLDMVREHCITGVCPEFYEEKIDDHGKKLCNFPCQKEEYLYWNGDCNPSCSDPYLKDDATHFCDYPCDENQSFDMVREHCITGACPEFYEEKTDDHGKKLCNFPCQKEEYLYWNGDCKPSCSDPYLKDDSTHFCDYPCGENQLFDMIREHCITGECPEFYEEKTDDHGKKLCNFPCQKEEYLYWNGDCKPSCSDPYLKDDATHFCDYPCGESQYLEVNTDKCISACSHVYEVKKIDKFNLCIYPCSGNQYLYSNGKCEVECPLPLRELITNDFKKYCMPSGPVGGGEHPTLPGEITLPVTINKQATKLSYVEKTLNADNEAWTLSSTDYTLNPTWTFFGLNSLGEYALDHWDTTSSCGCFRQVCGNDCQQGSECHINDNKTVPWICHPWAERNNYCWSIVSSGKNWFTSYSLKHISTIALTSYGGLDKTFVQPGFTITNQVANHNYAVNALIIKSNPRNNVNLEKSYRYAESEGRVVTIQEFEALNNIPTIQADLEKATCNSSAINLPLTLLSKMDGKLMSFHSYVILRKSELNTMKLLSGVEILAPTGVIEWNNQKEFDFIDPCNQQFLTLRKDDKGNFFVKLPTSQRLTNAESIICIAVQDNSKSQYDLVLYELKNSTLTWTASNRFAGLLSKDYIQDFTVRLTTQANPVVTELSKNNIDVQFHINSEPVFILVRTTTPTTCQLYLSPSCTYDISTEPSPHYATKSLGSDCGDLYEKATYNCEGLIGHFFPPNSLVKTPISNFVENTTVQRNSTQIFATSKPLMGDEIYRLYFWLTHWTWQNCLTKVFILSVLALLIAGVVLLSMNLGAKQRKKKHNDKGYSNVNNESYNNDDIDESGANDENYA